MFLIMKSKSEKLKEAYEYLRYTGKVSTQKDFSEKLEFNKENLSSAFNGKEMYLTDNLFKKICWIFPNVFNIDYFLKDEGEMLMPNNNMENNKISRSNVQQGNYINDVNFVNQFFDIIKKRDEQIDRLINLIEKKYEQ